MFFILKKKNSTRKDKAKLRIKTTLFVLLSIFDYLTQIHLIQTNLFFKDKIYPILKYTF